MALLPKSTPYPFLKGGGEMGHLTRSFLWSQTPLGSPDGWPPCLRTTLSILLNAKFPMFLFWGPDLRCFYNDAYRPSLGNQGKHSQALGQPGHQAWPEIWATVKPWLDQVMAGGEAIWGEDQLIPIDRNGQLEDVYWTFSLSPIHDESDRVAGVLLTCTETTRAVLSRQSLLRSEARFQNLLMQAPVAIALFRGPNFVIELANQRVLEYWDRSLEQVLGKPLFEALPEASGQGYEELLNRVLTTGEPFVTRELSVDLVRDGQLEKTYIDFVYEAYYEADQTIQGVMVMANDITQQVTARLQVEEQVQQRTQELARVNDDLHRSNDNLQQFAYVASHDLQEPLRKVQQFGNLLKNQYADQLGDGNDYLIRMLAATSRMSILIKDLLAFARISTLPSTMMVSVSLTNVIQTALADLDLSIQETEAVVSVEWLPVVKGDRSQLEQLFVNLISNALKFRQLGVKPLVSIRAQSVEAIDLPVGLKPTSQAKTYHRIDVSDNGIGFEQKYVDRIFLVFQRLHGKNQYAGTGIGLAICEKVVANHGGAIAVMSQPGQGTVFSVYLPD